MWSWTFWVVAVYVIGFVAEFTGGLGVVLNARRARAMLRNPPPSMVTEASDGLTFTITAPDGFSEGETQALKALALPIPSIVLLGVGIVAGFLGNLMSLRS